MKTTQQSTAQQAQHTPGPFTYEVKEKVNGSSFIVRSDGHHCYEGYGYSTAALHKIATDSTAHAMRIWKHNQLHKAAPELLEALNQLLNCAVWAKQMIGNIPESSHLAQTIIEARSAIARAKGRICD